MATGQRMYEDLSPRDRKSSELEDQNEEPAQEDVELAAGLSRARPPMCHWLERIKSAQKLLGTEHRAVSEARNLLTDGEAAFIQERDMVLLNRGADFANERFVQEMHALYAGACQRLEDQVATQLEQLQNHKRLLDAGPQANHKVEAERQAAMKMLQQVIEGKTCEQRQKEHEFERKEAFENVLEARDDVKSNLEMANRILRLLRCPYKRCRLQETAAGLRESLQRLDKIIEHENSLHAQKK